MTDTIETFIKEISDIEELDYGDFMRRAHLYWEDLSAQLALYHNPNIEHKLAEMQMYIEFNPSWEIPGTREKILKDAHYLDELLLGEKQDWESPC